MLFFPPLLSSFPSTFASLTFVPKVSEHVRTSMPRRGDAVPHHLQLLVAQHASLQPRCNVIEIRSFIYLLLLHQFQAGISVYLVWGRFAHQRSVKKKKKRKKTACIECLFYS